MKELNPQALQNVSAPLAPEQNRLGTDAAVQEVLVRHAAGPRPGSNAARRKGGQGAKRRGRLDREVLAKLGKGLKDCFADVHRQEVPERFKVLLRQL